MLGEGAVEGLAEIVDVAAQGVAVRRLAVPKVAFDGAARDDAGVFAQQQLEQAESGARQRDGHAVPGDFGGVGVENQIGYLVATRQSLGTPRQCLDASHQFRHVEGLDEIVVGTGVKARELVLEPVPGRQHDDRRGDAGILAQPFADLEAVHAGQHDVEHHHVVGFGDGEMHRHQAVGRIVHVVAASFEIGAGGLGEFGVVLREQDVEAPAHRRSSPAMAAERSRASFSAQRRSSQGLAPSLAMAPAGVACTTTSIGPATPARKCQNRGAGRGSG